MNSSGNQHPLSKFSSQCNKQEHPGSTAKPPSDTSSPLSHLNGTAPTTIFSWQATLSHRWLNQGARPSPTLPSKTTYPHTAHRGLHQQQENEPNVSSPTPGIPIIPSYNFLVTTPAHLAAHPHTLFSSEPTTTLTFYHGGRGCTSLGGGQRVRHVQGRLCR